MATSPFNIIAGPAEVFVAPVGTAFPAINTDPPGGNWLSLGVTEGGISVAHRQTVDLLSVDQSTGPRKAIRSEEGLEVSFSLAALTLENYRRALNGATVTTGGSPETHSLKMYQGLDVSQYALLIRGPSPYMSAYMQYEVPVAVETGDAELTFMRNDKSVLTVQFTALEDPNAATTADRFGTLRARST